MGVQIKWYDPNKQILLYTFDPSWTWMRLFEARTLGGILMNEAGRQDIGQIMYFTGELRLPSNSLLQWRKLAASSRSDVYLTAMIAPHSPRALAAFVRVFENHFPAFKGQFVAAKHFGEAARQVKAALPVQPQRVQFRPAFSAYAG